MTLVSTVGLPRRPRLTPTQALARMNYWRLHGTNVGVGMCMRTAARAYGYYASGEYSAWSFWLHQPELYCHYNASAPGGALVVWKGGPNGYGHIGIADGTGRFYGPDILRWGRIDLVPISWVASRWGLTFRGWTPPYFPRASGVY